MFLLPQSVFFTVFSFQFSEFSFDCALSLCRIMTSCFLMAWQSGPRCLLGVPAKARAQNPLASTSEPQKSCPFLGPTVSPTNFWLIWPTGQRQTCVLSALTCCASQGQGSPTTLQDRRPLCREANVFVNLLNL